MKQTILDRWLEEFILCGYAWPITRIQAINEMVVCGFTHQQAINALCWYKEQI